LEARYHRNIGNNARNNKHGYTGIKYHTQTRNYVSEITIKSKTISLGYFIEPEDAGKQYQKALEMVKILEQTSEDFNHIKNYYQLCQKYQEVITQAS
jgi:hypothetical protein